MYERVLVPLDGGPRGEIALEVGRRLADLWGAELDALALLDVGDNPTRREKTIERQTAETGPTHVEVRSVTYTVADEIADEFRASEGTLIVMATSARQRSAGLVGSIAEDVLRFVEAPVLLIGPNAEVPPGWPLGPMFVCTDGSAASETIVPHTVTVAKGLEVDPWVITVAEPIELAASTGVETDAIETNYPAAIAHQIEGLMGATVNFDVLHHGHPAAAIVEYARDSGAGLIALATHGRTGLRRVTLGSVAMAVVHDAPCPVLVSRPPEIGAGDDLGT